MYILQALGILFLNAYTVTSAQLLTKLDTEATLICNVIQKFIIANKNTLKSNGIWMILENKTKNDYDTQNCILKNIQDTPVIIISWDSNFLKDRIGQEHAFKPNFIYTIQNDTNITFCPIISKTVLPRMISSILIWVVTKPVKQSNNFKSFLRYANYFNNYQLIYPSEETNSTRLMQQNFHALNEIKENQNLRMAGSWFNIGTEKPDLQGYTLRTIVYNETNTNLILGENAIVGVGKWFIKLLCDYSNTTYSVLYETEEKRKKQDLLIVSHISIGLEFADIVLNEQLMWSNKDPDQTENTLKNCIVTGLYKQMLLIPINHSQMPLVEGLKSFTFGSVILYISIMFGISCAWYFLHYISTSEEGTIIFIIINLIRSLLGGGVHYRDIVKNERFIVFTLLWTNFLYNNCYQTVLMRNLIQPSAIRPIQNVNDFFNSNLTILYLRWGDVANVAESNDKFRKHHMKPRQCCTRYEEIFQLIANGTYQNYALSMSETEANAFLNIPENQYRRSRFYYKMWDPIYSSILVHYASAKVIKATNLNVLKMRINEAGLENYWILKSMFEINEIIGRKKNILTTTGRDGNDTETSIVGTRDILSMVLPIATIGGILSLFVLICEIIWFNLTKIRYRSREGLII